jgi:hypothetical protein
VTANRAASSVSVLRGKGDGSFRKAVHFPTGKGPVAVLSADFNGDGVPDLATADSLGNTVSVLLGKGDGSFRAPVSYPTGKNPAAVAVADVNGDGKPDLVVADYDDGTVSVLLGKGDGTFRRSAKFPAGQRLRGLVVGDFNGDGKLDLAVTNWLQEGAVSVLLGKGDGTFHPAVSYPAGSYPIAVVAADFNRDGKLDLAVANFGSGDVNVFLGKGDGTFHTPNNYGGGGGYLFALLAADLNSNGKLDLAVANVHQYNGVSLLAGKGEGTFQRPDAHWYGTGLYPTGIAWGHFRRAARPDLVVANARSDNLSVLLNRPAAPDLAIGAGVNEVTAIAADGTTFAVGVGARDARGNPDAGYAGTLQFQSSDPRAQLPADYTVRRGSKFDRPFKVTLKTRGTQTITVRDKRGRRLPATVFVRVLTLADLHFELEAPKTVVAGQPFSLTVNVMEPLQSPELWSQNTYGYAGMIRFSCSDRAAVLPGAYRFSGRENLHVFTNKFRLHTPGKWTLTVTDPAHPTLTASTSIVVTPARRSFE